MKIFEHDGDFFITSEDGDEWKVVLDYDYSPAQKADMTDPAFDAEFCINSIELDDNSFPVQLEWIENLKEFEKEMVAK